MEQIRMPNIQLPQSWAVDWEINRPLGSGAYSTVYRAVRRDHPGIDAAIKVITIPASDTETDTLRSEGFTADQSQSYYDDVARQYISEIEMMEELKGTSHIVGIEDYKVIRRTDTIGNYIFIRMELLTPLETLMRQRTLTEKEVLRVGIDICSALELCAARNILHRDIKPANIFINDKTPGYVFYELGDFGVARSMQSLTHGLSTKGTPNYMAPEVFTGKPYDQRADLYSLGITLYRLLNNNCLPFSSKNDLSVSSREGAVARRMSGEKLPPPCHGSEAASRSILRACEFSPEDRYADALEMKAALEAALFQGSEPSATGHTVRPPLPEKSPVQPTQNGSIGSVPLRKKEQQKEVPAKKAALKSGKKERTMIAVAVICALAAICILIYGLVLRPTSGPVSTPTLLPTDTTTPSATPTPTDEPTPTVTLPTSSITPAPSSEVTPSQYFFPTSFAHILPGERSSIISEVQDALYKKGYYVGITSDYVPGYFDEPTEEAVQRFCDTMHITYSSFDGITIPLFNSITSENVPVYEVPTPTPDPTPVVKLEILDIHLYETDTDKETEIPFSKDSGTLSLTKNNKYKLDILATNAEFMQITRTIGVEDTILPYTIKQIESAPDQKLISLILKYNEEVITPSYWIYIDDTTSGMTCEKFIVYWHDPIESVSDSILQTGSASPQQTHALTISPVYDDIHPVVCIDGATPNSRLLLTITEPETLETDSNSASQPENSKITMPMEMSASDDDFLLTFSPLKESNESESEHREDKNIILNVDTAGHTEFTQDEPFLVGTRITVCEEDSPEIILAQTTVEANTLAEIVPEDSGQYVINMKNASEIINIQGTAKENRALLAVFENTIQTFSSDENGKWKVFFPLIPVEDGNYVVTFRYAGRGTDYQKYAYILIDTCCKFSSEDGQEGIISVKEGSEKIKFYSGEPDGFEDIRIVYQQTGKGTVEIGKYEVKHPDENGLITYSLPSPVHQDDQITVYLKDYAGNDTGEDGVRVEILPIAPGSSDISDYSTPIIHLYEIGEKDGIAREVTTERVEYIQYSDYYRFKLASNAVYRLEIELSEYAAQFVDNLRISKIIPGNDEQSLPYEISDDKSMITLNEFSDEDHLGYWLYFDSTTYFRTILKIMVSSET